MSGKIEIWCFGNYLGRIQQQRPCRSLINCVCGLLLIWGGKKMLAAVSEITNKLKAKTFTIVAWEWECPVKCAGTNSGIQEPLFPDRTCTNSGTTSNVSVRDA